MECGIEKLFVSSNELDVRLEHLASVWGTSSQGSLLSACDILSVLVLGLCDPSTHNSCARELFRRGQDWEKLLPPDLRLHLQRDETTHHTEASKQSEVIVDIERGVIKHQGKVTISFPLCHLLSLIEKSRPVVFSEILHVCFGEPEYFTKLHASKVYNLLNRAKRILGRESLFCRAEVMHVHHPLKPMRILRPPAVVEHLLNS